MLDALRTTRQALLTADRRRARAFAAADGWRLAARLASLLAAAMALDLFLPLPALLRGLLAVGVAARAVTGGRALRRRARTEPFRPERAARLLESRHPDLESALINAVQFGTRLETRPGDPAEPLMRREMARAENEAARLPVEDAPDRAAIAHARRPALALGGLLLLSALLSPRAWRFEVPRFFAFWADHPPFTLTDFRVTPHGARVPAGGRVEIAVRVGGRLPDTLELVTQAGREPEQAIPLYAEEDGVYRQRLEGLTEDVTYHVRADTGRTGRWRVSVIPPPPTPLPAATAPHASPSADAPPAVAVTAPGMDVVVLPGIAVPLRIEAEDDHALARVEVQVRHRGERALPLSLPPGRRRADLRTRLDLRTLGARPGDIITYRAAAQDDRGGSGVSETYRLQVVSATQYRQLVARFRSALKAGRAGAKGSARAAPSGGRPGSSGRAGRVAGGAPPLEMAAAISSRANDMRQAGGGVTLRRPTGRKPGSGAPGELAPEAVEYLTGPAHVPAPAQDAPAARVPPQYRQLVRDYFRAIADGK